MKIKPTYTIMIKAARSCMMVKAEITMSKVKLLCLQGTGYYINFAILYFPLIQCSAVSVKKIIIIGGL